MLAGVTVLCAGVTLGIIAGLGQTTSTAAASAIAGAAGIKVGTASIYLYGVFFLLQILMLRSKFKWGRCFQLLPILAHGVLLNFFRRSSTLLPKGISSRCFASCAEWG